MADTTHVAQPTDDPGTACTARTSRLHQALRMGRHRRGRMFIVAAIFFAGFFLNYSEHMHMHMGMRRWRTKRKTAVPT